METDNDEIDGKYFESELFVRGDPDIQVFRHFYKDSLLFWHKNKSAIGDKKTMEPILKSLKTLKSWSIEWQNMTCVKEKGLTRVGLDFVTILNRMVAQQNRVTPSQSH